MMAKSASVFGLCVLLLAGGGFLLDRTLDARPWFTFLGVFLGMAVGLAAGYRVSRESR